MAATATESAPVREPSLDVPVPSFARTVTVWELRNSLEQRFLVRVRPHFTGTQLERKPENPGRAAFRRFSHGDAIEKTTPAQLP
jgi:hypothetical protein